MGKPFLPNLTDLPAVEVPARVRWQRRAYLFFVAFVPMLAILLGTRDVLGEFGSLVAAMCWGLVATLGWNLILRWRILRALRSEGLGWSDLPRLMSEHAARSRASGEPRTSDTPATRVSS